MPGDLDRFFVRMVSQFANKYETTIWSGPAEYTSPENPNFVPTQATLASDVLVDGPWVITLENVFTEEECQHFIDMGYKKGYERSKDVGEKKFDGTFDALLNPRRTSTNAWCSDECYNDTKVEELTQRLEDLTGVPSNVSEYLQLLRYEETQAYQVHHDYIQYQVDRAEGVRIFTLFIYLNTVEAGGGTRFHKLNNLTVNPVRGRILLWPSVLNGNADLKDVRTEHEALPVEKGIKYGANGWYHQRDYKVSYDI
jgi:prolyl 4-hydroxylase